jgi:GNAT superfamily N-acetyltransferase
MMIRGWHESDKECLVEMIQDCLAINHGAGAEMLPTKKNAEALWAVGIQASNAGQPCYVAVERGVPVGYTLWCELPNVLGLDFCAKIMHGLGTYVAPAYRNTGVSKRLRDEAEGLAKQLGYDKIVGIAYHEAGFVTVAKRGWKAVGVNVEKVL